MFLYVGPLHPEVQLWVLEADEGKVLADGGTPAHVYAQAGPETPFPALDIRRPSPAPTSGDGVELVIRVAVAELSPMQREQLREDLYRWSFMWPYGAPELYDRPVVIAATRLTVSHWLGGLEISTLTLAGAGLLAFLALPALRAAPTPEQRTAERLARAGERALSYLRSLRVQLVLCGGLFVGALLLGIAALGLGYGGLPSMARPDAGWQAQAFFSVLIVGLVGLAAWIVQLLRLQGEIRRLGSLPPPSVE